jgi:hypothetical protein
MLSVLLLLVYATAVLMRIRKFIRRDDPAGPGTFDKKAFLEMRDAASREFLQTFMTMQVMLLISHFYGRFLSLSLFLFLSFPSASASNSGWKMFDCFMREREENPTFVYSGPFERKIQMLESIEQAMQKVFSHLSSC